jgi:hypothetical protein
MFTMKSGLPADMNAIENKCLLSIELVSLTGFKFPWNLRVLTSKLIMGPKLLGRQPIMMGEAFTPITTWTPPVGSNKLYILGMTLPLGHSRTVSAKTLFTGPAAAPSGLTVFMEFAPSPSFEVSLKEGATTHTASCGVNPGENLVRFAAHVDFPYELKSDLNLEATKANLRPLLDIVPGVAVFRFLLVKRRTNSVSVIEYGNIFDAPAAAGAGGRGAGAGLIFHAFFIIALIRISSCSPYQPA